MYALRLVGPSQLVEVEIPALSEHSHKGLIEVRLSAAGICGSDLPHFRTPAADVEAGYPIHECVGRVVSLAGGQAATGPRLAIGDRVVAMPVGKRGLAEIYLARPEATHRVVDVSLTDGQATLIQPLATVQHAVSRLGEVEGARVAIIGLGPIGLLAAHLLRRRGASHIIGIEPADRGQLAALVGVDVVTGPGREAEEVIRCSPMIDVCVEAVGHQTNTLADAVTFTGFGGAILALGVPNDEDYVWPFRHFFRKNLTLHASVNPPWRPAMAAAEEYLTRHRSTLTGLITHNFDIREGNRAFDLYASRSPGRGKVVLNADSWTDRRRSLCDQMTRS